MRINILEIHASLNYGGCQRNIFTFVKNLNRSIFNVFVASYVEGGFYEEKLKEIGIEYLSTKKDINKIIEFIKEKKIDIIHIHRSGGYVSIETKIIEGAKSFNQSIVVETNIFGKSDHVSGKYVDCSLFQSMMHVNERYLPIANVPFDFKKMKVFYNMVDSEEFEKFRLTQKEISVYKNSLGILKEDFVIGKIARPDLSKWSDLVLDMMPYLVKLVPSIKFIIIGAPSSRIRKIQKSIFADRIILKEATGDQRQIHGFYQSIDVLAHSSKIGECNGNTINEAMFWEKPVVVNSTPSRDNGQLEQVDHMIDGIIANHPQTFARAIEYLYRNRKKMQSMGECGHRKVLEVNNPYTSTRMLEKVFIEKIKEKDIDFNLPSIALYDKVSYYPSEQEIEGFKPEYQKRLSWEFGKLSAKERVVNLFRKPVGFYWKIKDYLDHNHK